MDRHPAVTPQQLQMMLPPPMEIIIITTTTTTTTTTLPEWNESQMIHFGRIFYQCATADFEKSRDSITKMYLAVQICLRLCDPLAIVTASARYSK
jgi:TPP-dependent trihydroxycyclohexane-1,2-dione (THcHDO) dehydratase